MTEGATSCTRGLEPRSLAGLRGKLAGHMACKSHSAVTAAVTSPGRQLPFLGAGARIHPSSPPSRSGNGLGKNPPPPRFCLISPALPRAALGPVSHPAKPALGSIQHHLPLGRALFPKLL